MTINFKHEELLARSIAELIRTCIAQAVDECERAGGTEEELVAAIDEGAARASKSIVGMIVESIEQYAKAET